MSNLIPNQNSWIGFLAGSGANKFGVPTASLGSPTAANISGSVDLTDFLITLNASTTGNTVPTPRLRSLFETSVPGLASAQCTADMYRDDEIDTAWLTLPRGTSGCFLVSRFGGTGTNKAPAVGQKVEVWPVTVVSRAGGALQSGTAQMFTVTASVPIEPREDATVAA